MMFKSIRPRLALSFAGIALVAALALGAVLLAILRNYYLNQELDYLRGNAQSISDVVMAMMSADAPHDEVQLQIENLAFLSQTRIQVYSPQGQLLYDSGSPQNVDLNIGVMKQIFAQNNDALPKDMVFVTVGGFQNSKLPPFDEVTSPAPPIPDVKKFFVYRSVQAGGSPFGFELRLKSDTAPVTARSNLRIAELMQDPKNNNKLGMIQLSEGPAYGSAILTSVAYGWAFASAIAVLLAAAIGWYISRRISAPVLALTDVTTRMAQGNLSSRATARSQDEFGQLARSFNEMADQVETTVTTLRRFVSDAAHELNSPLTALQTNLEMALDDTLAPGASAGESASRRTLYLSRAQEQSQRLEAMVKSLLDLSRIEATQSAPSFELLDLRQLVSEIGETFASRAEQAGRVFNLILPDGAVPFRGNALQLQRAVNNLLDNALKFTPVNGFITLSLDHSETEVILTITDTGIGIPSDDLPHLFERFHRGRNSAEYPGNGLGLAIVKAIMDAHHGRVEAQSTDTGSTFSILLPKS
jgi:signal transduction histidine kinase